MGGYISAFLFFSVRFRFLGDIGVLGIFEVGKVVLLLRVFAFILDVYGEFLKSGKKNRHVFVFRQTIYKAWYFIKLKT